MHTSRVVVLLVCLEMNVLLSDFLVSEMRETGQISRTSYQTKELLHLIHGIHRSADSKACKERCLPSNYRDLRRLDFSYTPSEDSAILIRKHALLLSFHPIRVIVTSDYLFILLQSSDHETIADLITDQMKVR